MEWSGVEWGGVGWGGVGWSGVEWSGVEWSGVEWSGVEWGGVGWGGVEWGGVGWGGVGWGGVGWGGVGWGGVEWSGVEWSGVEWSGVEWSGKFEFPEHFEYSQVGGISVYRSPQMGGKCRKWGNRISAAVNKSPKNFRVPLAPKWVVPPCSPSLWVGGLGLECGLTRKRPLPVDEKLWAWLQIANCSATDIALHNLFGDTE